MFCIAAFIVLAIISIFSVSHRKLARQAWHCVVRRVTFKPCDINFSEEVKGKILGKLILRRPKLAKFLNKSFDWLAFIFVVLSIWSVVAVFFSALNLWVYDTCNPTNGESCSLSGEACGLERPRMGFVESIQRGALSEWFVTSLSDFGETVSRVPDRFKNWDAKDYLSPTATFYAPLDQSKKYAVEVMDPSCHFCKQQYETIQKAGLENDYNFSYVLYPIPSKSSPNGYKFPNSYLMASYIEATKMVPLATVKTPSADWQLLGKVFAEQDNAAPVGLQKQFPDEADFLKMENKIKEMLRQIGYSEAQIAQIAELAHGEKVKASLLAQQDIVENKLKTVKIPTLVFNGRRFDRVVDGGALK